MVTNKHIRRRWWLLFNLFYSSPFNSRHTEECWNGFLVGVYMRPEMKSSRNEILTLHKRKSVYITFHCGRNEVDFISGVIQDKRPIK